MKPEKQYVSEADMLADDSGDLKLNLLPQEEPGFHCGALIGPSGSGKSTILRERIEQDPDYAVLTATTGIAAVNLGAQVTTINSALGYFDLASLAAAHRNGEIREKARYLAKKRKKKLVIDEVSMFPAEALDIVYAGFKQAADDVENDNGNKVQIDRIQPTGMLLSGDFCQLGPISKDRSKPAKFAFEADCWPEFEKGLTRLTKIYRQEDAAFLEALMLCRKGHPADAAIAFRKAGAQFAQHEDPEFDGVTIFGMNQEVEDCNRERYNRLPGREICFQSERWGRERSEWKTNIPDKLLLKIDALVMVLANQPKTFEYVNGDLAHLKDCVGPLGGSYDLATIETQRGYKGPLPMTIARNYSYKPEDSLEETFKKGSYAHLLHIPPERDPCPDEGCKPDDEPNGQYRSICEQCGYEWGWRHEDGWEIWASPRKLYWREYYHYLEEHTMRGWPYFDPRSKGTVVGEVKYMPLRLAYASTVNKTQGLTMDRAQINLKGFWMSQPGMCYVALSRVRTAQGLLLIGDAGMLSKRIRTDSRLREWV